MKKKFDPPPSPKIFRVLWTAILEIQKTPAALRSFPGTGGILKVAAFLLGALFLSPAQSQNVYDTGASDTEIKLGQTMPYSGPASSYGTQGRTELAYWRMVNSKGGINGRKVALLSLDDGYNPSKTVEQTRRLIEQEEVLAIVGSFGTASNSATQKYLNGKKIPQILVSSGASRWNDPKNYPWTTSFYPTYANEAMIYGRYIREQYPEAKIGLIYQNDDAGKDYFKGLKEGLAAKANDIVKALSYDTTDPTIDSQIVALKAAGVDTLITMASAKFGAQAIRKVSDLGWKPRHFIGSTASSITGVLQPAGLEASRGLITALSSKVVGDPAWDSDPGVQQYLNFMREWYPEGNPIDIGNQVGYSIAQMTEIILRKCGNNLTRENVLKQSTAIEKVSLSLFLPEVTVSVTGDDYSAFKTFYLAEFDGTTWKPFGKPIDLGRTGE